MEEENTFKLSKLVEKLSHELRTPLNAILGYSELLEKSENLDDTEKKHLETIATSGSKLLDVINDIIEISNIESGKAEVESRAISALDLIQDLETKFGPAARLKDLEFILKLSNELKTPFLGDARKINSILNSLVNNAIKFTETGKILVELSLENGSDHESQKLLNVKIKDTGQGISEDDKQHIFKPFWQAESEHRVGTGLGLTTTKKLLNILKGDILIDSEQGKGTTVELQIPVNVIQLSEAQKDGEAEAHLNQETIKGLRALIVDDLPLNRTLARIMLEMKEFETIEAENGKEAVDRFNSKSPDVVLMDISMPIMDGIEAMERIRELNKEHGKEIPIIAITAGGHTGSRNELIQRGFSEYIQKPYREKELFEKISLFLPLKASNGKKVSLKRSAFRA